MIEYRPATLSDLEGLVSIENACFYDPWNEEMLSTELAAPHAHYLLQMVDGVLSGYYSYMHILDEAHIMNVAVLPSFQGRGLGRDMMKHLLSHLPADVVAVTLEVRRGNAVARHLYESVGFVLAGYRTGYYMDKEDAAIYWWTKGD